jgi:DNA-directed RNA polymerase, subunit E''
VRNRKSMYKKIILLDAVRVPPNKLYGDANAAVREELKNKLEGRIEGDIGLIMAITDIIEIDEGHIVLGMGACISTRNSAHLHMSRYYRR